MTTTQLRNSVTRPPLQRGFFLIPLLFSCRCSGLSLFSLLLGLTLVPSARSQNPPVGSTWGAVPESQRQAATSPINAGSRVTSVRQGLSGADPSGGRAFAVDADTEALRGTYRLVVPLLEAQGRDDALRINLEYQARIWLGRDIGNLAILDGSAFSAPGWSLNLPKLLGGILIEADGSRHPARKTRVTAIGQEETEIEYVATDGSNIKYQIRLDPPKPGADRTATAVIHYPDGALTVMEGFAGLNDHHGTSVLYTSLYPIAIIDRNGNTTTIENEVGGYQQILFGAPVDGTTGPVSFGDWGPLPPALPARPKRLVDAMGREVKFYY